MFLVCGCQYVIWLELSKAWVPAAYPWFTQGIYRPRGQRAQPLTLTSGICVSSFSICPQDGPPTPSFQMRALLKDQHGTVGRRARSARKEGATCRPQKWGAAQERGEGRGEGRQGEERIGDWRRGEERGGEGRC